MPPFSHPYGLVTGGRTHLNCFVLVIIYSRHPSERFDTVFSVGYISINKYHILHPLGVPGRGNPHLKLLSFHIQRSSTKEMTLFLALVSFPKTNVAFFAPLWGW